MTNNHPGKNIAVALVHHPTYNKLGEIGTTSVTGIDIHDFARICRTYGVSTLYVVTPLKAQAHLVERVMGHWTKGRGGEINPDRKEALKSVKVVDSVADMVDNFSLDTDKVKLVVTSAQQSERAVSYLSARKALQAGGKAIVLFGTGSGLASPVTQLADIHLEPIYGADEYNHLPVRCAAAIIMDRLLGQDRS